MNSVYCFILFIVLAACSETSDRNLDCEEVIAANTSNSFEIIQSIVFDTTANLLHVTVLDIETRKPIEDVGIALSQESTQKQMQTDPVGGAEIFENGFYGNWQLTVTHPDYRCLIIHDVYVEGGKSAVIYLKHH